MKKMLIVCCTSFCTLTSMAPADPAPENDEKKFASLLPAASAESPAVAYWVDSVYTHLRLDSMGLDRKVFFYAIKGQQYLASQQKLGKPNLITICDFTQSSKNKRLYVIDMQLGKVLFNTYVSHGRNSGSEYATSFSNRAESHKSSLGFLITADTYTGKAGYSLRLDGMEKGFNDKARSRAIVMHGSDYVNEYRTDDPIGMGRSYGCPAVPYKVHKQIINAIKGGSCMFLYGEDRLYTTASTILNAKFTWPSVLPVVPVLPQETTAGNSINSGSAAGL